MEPVPETKYALEEFGPYLRDDGTDLLGKLRGSADQVRTAVPSCVGLSLAFAASGATFTLQATDAEIAAFDGGRCVGNGRRGESLAYRVGNPLDETAWHTCTAKAAAPGVASTLTLPIIEGLNVTGVVDLYAAEPHAFVGRHEQLADIFGAWALGAVTNADLGFETRLAARAAPQVLRNESVVAQAVGLLMRLRRLDAARARALIEQAAARAGVSSAAVARDVIDIFGRVKDNPT